MAIFIHLLFWFSLIFIFYTYILYLIIIVLLASIYKKEPNKGHITPYVSFLIIAHNEGQIINDKIKNCLELEYPQDRIEYVIVSCGSTDDTDKIASSFEYKNVRLIRLNENKGKSFAINKVVPELKGEIILFSDARQIYETNCIKELVANFNDPTLGAVSGELMLSSKKKKEGPKGIYLYWNYEKLLRINESYVYSSLGTTGAIYAIRKELFESIPDDTILDDFVIPMSILKKGYRVIFDNKARAWDLVTESLSKEFRRKIRTIGGNYQAFSRMPFLFSYKNNPVFFQFISHKLFRLIAPYFLLLLFISNIFLDSIGYSLFLTMQISFYLFSLVGIKYYSGIFGIFGTFLILNFATVIGLYRFLTNSLDASWK